MNPNRRPFPRGRMLDRCGGSSVHRFLRFANERYYQHRNVRGWSHDLGAEDLFLDDMGVIFFEQFDWSIPAFPYLGVALSLFMARWETLKGAVFPDKPYWGGNYNSPRRTANAGEPRSLLRLDRGSDVLSESAGSDELETLESGRFDWEYLRHGFDKERFWPRGWDVPWYHEALRRRMELERSEEPWRFESLLPEELRWVDHLWLPETREPPAYESGVALPAGFTPRVPRYELLPVEFGTPDLPLRVGADDRDLQGYERFVRDQGPRPTCVSNAVCSALDLLRKRKSKQRGEQFFSADDLHRRSGWSLFDGRSLSQVVDELRNGLPASQLPGPRKSYGPPRIRKLGVYDIPRLKAHLAAGWVVVVTTYLPEETFHSNALQVLGAPLRPLPGMQRRSSGHAWTLVGYDHVDGNQQWKYQGCFVALNSWGMGFPSRPLIGRGLVALPFSFVFSEGIEAYALRLPSCEPTGIGVR